MKLFEQYTIKNVTLKNRIVMPPMCMYCADTEGLANEKHLVHYTTRAVGGVGLIIVEATAISPEGRILEGDLGIWDDAQIEGLRKITHCCHQYGAKMAIQLGHAGRKGFLKNENLAPSALAFSEELGMPKELSPEEIGFLVEKYKQSAERAVKAGFDMIEIHGAHGYLIHEFLSPLTNKRADAFGGSLENRVRFLKDVLGAVRSVVPKDMPVTLRVSASDYAEGGLTIEEMIRIINQVKEALDMVHVSSGGLLSSGIKSYPGYQIEFARAIKESCQIPTIAVGLITNATMVAEILENNRADLVALGRELLRNPYWVLEQAKLNQIAHQIPTFYERGF